MAITHAELKHHFRYHPRTGTWERLRQCGSMKPGTKVGFIVRDREGRLYNFLTFRGARYKMSRLAFFYMRGEWPVGVVDHKDGDTLNDRWRNLRDCDPERNNWNKGTYSNNKSGFKGVNWCKARSCWIARIRVKSKRHFLGYFDDPATAGLVYKAAARKHFGEFARA